MDKREFLKLLSSYFRMESSVVNLKSPDFELKSHIFYYKDFFKDISEIRILRVTSKNPQDNILFDIYYDNKEFEGLFHGFFRIKPESHAAQRIFQNVSKICTDLAEYFYYVYQTSDFLKIYMISGDLNNTLAQCEEKDLLQEFCEIKKRMYSDIAAYSVDEFNNNVLNRRFNEKYISNFIKFNSKCSEAVKMFLINILSFNYSDYVCILNRGNRLKHYVSVNPNHAVFSSDSELPLYGLLDYIVDNPFVLFVYFDFDFKGGV